MLSPEALSLQVGYALVAAAALAPRLPLVRAFLSVAASAWLARALSTGDAVGAAWSGLILALCLVLLGRRLWELGGAGFTDEERRMAKTLFAGLPRSRARHLIDQGLWLNGKAGDVLTREGEPVEHLCYLSEGEARVISAGRQVGRCRAGDLVGELTVLSGETASATVVLDGPARFWCAPAADLRPYVDAHDDVRRALEQGFAAQLKAKLRASNRTIADAGGIAGAS